MLEPIYRGSDVRVREIPGLHFYYTPSRRLDYLRTGREAAAYLGRMNGLVSSLTETIRRERPNLVIVDFEPALPRAARRAGIPFLSVNHQHFLVVSDLSSLPPALRRHAAYMSWIVRTYYSGQAETVVSSFYFPPLKPKYRNVTQVGVLLRPEMLRAAPECRGHLCVYLRKFAPKAVLEALRECGRPVRIYGLGARPEQGNLRYFEISESGFLEDLATCDALVTTAGNQLVGEALFLRKPVFAMPEARNFEQYINAHFLRAEGGGDWAEMELVNTAILRGFLDRIEEYRAHIRPDRVNGNPATLAAIRRHLPRGGGESAAPT